ncbi:UDP-glucuronosyl/UDP-glucosyltransferase [Trinorchestia longiramus]|nr:UDP-glucuronosyl/UDP-glucosyltransferase [Trinorchestia longiramus]
MQVAYPFLDGLPFITVSTSIVDPVHSAMMGNLLNPAYVSNMVQEFPRPYSFVNRFKNMVLTFFVPYLFWRHIEVPVQKEISKKFPHLPLIHEMKKNQSMTFINSHFSFSTPIPLLPNQVEIGGIHTRSPGPLPQELREFIAGSTPVVYMSLGSIARSSHIPSSTFKMFLSAFEKLPYNFLWKFEKQLYDVPKNLLMWEWFPQQDVLGHPNVKAFISHRGLLGVEEAVYHSTPMMLLPLMGDQPKNAAILHNAGVGIKLSWNDLTEQMIIDAIQELMNNSSYKEKISKMSSIFRDQKETPLDRAVFWTEYTIRHQGALDLRSPEHGLSWIQILHLDLILVIYVVLYFMYKLMSKLALVFRDRSIKQSKTNNLDTFDMLGK